MAAASRSQHAGRSAGSASADASQLGGKSAATVRVFRIGSFNVIGDQNMFISKRRNEYVSKVEDIIKTGVQDAGLHIMNFCELGGHYQGPSGSR